MDYVTMVVGSQEMSDSVSKNFPEWVLISSPNTIEDMWENLEKGNTILDVDAILLDGTLYEDDGEAFIETLLLISHSFFVVVLYDYTTPQEEIRSFANQKARTGFMAPPLFYFADAHEYMQQEVSAAEKSFTG